MSKTVFITQRIPQRAVAMLREKGYGVDVSLRGRALTKRQLIRALKKKSYDAVLSLLTDTIDAEVFDAAPSVKLYANYASGFDNIDLVAAEQRGISVANAPAVSTAEAVAEHTIALMMSLATRIVEADRFVRKGRYKGWAPLRFIGMDLSGKTLGLIGAGHIGERVAVLARGLGMNVLYTDIARNQSLDHAGAGYIATIDELLPRADVVSLHVPLIPSTKHLITAARLSRMKKDALLINTSRGAVIDERALVEALEQRIIRGAALDVFEFEPRLSRGLAKLHNVILTPHIASASAQARIEMAELAAHNIIDFFEGKIPANIVTKK